MGAVVAGEVLDGLRVRQQPPVGLRCAAQQQCRRDAAAKQEDAEGIAEQILCELERRKAC